MVLYLCQGLENEGRKLYTNTFHTSVTLAKLLLEKKIYLVGLLGRKRKYLPKQVLNRKLEINEVYGEETEDGRRVMKWKSKTNKEVLMLSTKHGTETEEVISRNIKQTKAN